MSSSRICLRRPVRRSNSTPSSVLVTPRSGAAAKLAKGAPVSPKPGKPALGALLLEGRRGGLPILGGATLPG